MRPKDIVMVHLRRENTGKEGEVMDEVKHRDSTTDKTKQQDIFRMMMTERRFMTGRRRNTVKTGCKPKDILNDITKNNKKVTEFFSVVAGKKRKVNGEAEDEMTRDCKRTGKYRKLPLMKILLPMMVLLLVTLVLPVAIVLQVTLLPPVEILPPVTILPILPGAILPPMRIY